MGRRNNSTNTKLEQFTLFSTGIDPIFIIIKFSLFDFRNIPSRNNWCDCRRRNRIGPPGNRVARFHIRLNTFRRQPPRHSYGYDSPNHPRQIVPPPNSMVQITGSISWSRSPSGTPPPARDPTPRFSGQRPTAGSRTPCRIRNAPRKESCRRH